MILYNFDHFENHELNMRTKTANGMFMERGESLFGRTLVLVLLLTFLIFTLPHLTAVPIVVRRAAPHHCSRAERYLHDTHATMGGVDEDGLISGLKEEELITNEEMDQLVKEVRASWVDALSSRIFADFSAARVCTRACVCDDERREPARPIPRASTHDPTQPLRCVVRVVAWIVRTPVATRCYFFQPKKHVGKRPPTMTAIAAKESEDF